jgi:flagellar hook protein FlgE
MMRSLYSGVTGLRNHQTRMDVIGNNIANVNTVGFKASRVVFQDIYSQTLTPASGPDTDSGGTNPKQIGLGMSLATVDVLHTKSAAQYTGADLDLSIEGDGFFTVSNGGALYYTRAGNFYTDKDNNLVTGSGDFVQGYQVDTDGNLILDAFGDPIMININIDPNYYDVTINSNGAIVGLNKSTNDEDVLGQVVLATFANQNALEKAGSNTYRNTINSGDPAYSIPGSGGSGTLNPGTLEMTNVDLANEFTDMIVTQRGFQANSRIISTTDSMLEELVNLKR